MWRYIPLEGQRWCPSLTVCAGIRRVTHSFQSRGGKKKSFIPCYTGAFQMSALASLKQGIRQMTSTEWSARVVAHIPKSNLCKDDSGDRKSRGRNKKEFGMKSMTLIKFSQYVHYWTAITFAIECMKALCDLNTTYWLTENFYSFE